MNASNPYNPAAVQKAYQRIAELERQNEAMRQVLAAISETCDIEGHEEACKLIQQIDAVLADSAGNDWVPFSTYRELVSTHEAVIAELSDVRNRAELAEDAYGELEAAVDAKINGKSAYAYLCEQFPAMVGHIPIKQYFIGLGNAMATPVGSLRAKLVSVRDVLRDAQMHIEADNIDWARLGQGPDHDPNYKPEFPEIVKRLSDAIKLLEAK